jgi:hypothetical protein
MLFLSTDDGTRIDAYAEVVGSNRPPGPLLLFWLTTVLN